MPNQNTNYIISKEFPELGLLLYYYEHFNTPLSDVWLPIIEVVDLISIEINDYKECMGFSLNNMVVSGNCNLLQLPISDSDIHTILDGNDGEIAELLDSVIKEIISTIYIPLPEDGLYTLLEDMQTKFGLVNSFYTIEDGRYISDYSMVDVIEVIYYEVLHYIIQVFHDNIIDMIKLRLAGYDIDLVDVIPDKSSINYNDKLMIIYKIS